MAKQQRRHLTIMEPEELAPPAIPLTSLPKGRLAAIATILEPHDSRAVSYRLCSMGLVPGTTVRMDAQAPFGGPLTILVRGYKLALREAEAKLVQVIPLA